LISKKGKIVEKRGIGKMNKMINLLIIVAGVSFIVGLVFRVVYADAPRGAAEFLQLSPLSFQRFTNSCLLFAISLMGLQWLKSKKG